MNLLYRQNIKYLTLGIMSPIDIALVTNSLLGSQDYDDASNHIQQHCIYDALNQEQIDVQLILQCQQKLSRYRQVLEKNQATHASIKELCNNARVRNITKLDEEIKRLRAFETNAIAQAQQLNTQNARVLHGKWWWFRRLFHRKQIQQALDYNLKCKRALRNQLFCRNREFVQKCEQVAAEIKREHEKITAECSRLPIISEELKQSYKKLEYELNNYIEIYAKQQNTTPTQKTVALQSKTLLQQLLNKITEQEGVDDNTIKTEHINT